MMVGLEGFPVSKTTSTVVEAPLLHMFAQEANIQVLEDFPSATDMASSFLSSPATSLPSNRLNVTLLGQRLGSWLRSFHQWISADEQAPLRIEVGSNESMRCLKYDTSYDSFIKVLENFPDILEGHQETLAAVKSMAAKEFSRLAAPDTEEYWGIIHGDFWTGKLVFPFQTYISRKTFTDKIIIVIVFLFRIGHCLEERDQRSPASLSSLTGSLLNSATEGMIWGTWSEISTK